MKQAHTIAVRSRGFAGWEVIGDHKGRRAEPEGWKSLTTKQRTRLLEIELILLELEIAGHRRIHKALVSIYRLHRQGMPRDVKEEFWKEMALREGLVANLHAAIMYRKDRLGMWRNRADA